MAFLVKPSFFITKVSNIDDFSHDHFELKNFILAQKLAILEGGLHQQPFLLNFHFFVSKVSNIIAESNDDFLGGLK